VIVTLAKLFLANAMVIRELQAAVYHTLFLNTNSPVISGMQQAGASYTTRTRGFRPDVHQLDPPVPYIAEAMIRALTGMDLGSLLQPMLTLHASMTDPRAAMAIVRVCRQRRCRNCDCTRLYFLFASPGDQTLMVDSLIKVGAILAEGAAPAGALEFELSRFIGRRR